MPLLKNVPAPVALWAHVHHTDLVRLACAVDLWRRGYVVGLASNYGAHFSVYHRHGPAMEHAFASVQCLPWGQRPEEVPERAHVTFARLQQSVGKLAIWAWVETSSAAKDEVEEQEQQHSPGFADFTHRAVAVVAAAVSLSQARRVRYWLVDSGVEALHTNPDEPTGKRCRADEATNGAFRPAASTTTTNGRSRWPPRDRVLRPGRVSQHFLRLFDMDPGMEPLPPTGGSHRDPS